MECVQDVIVINWIRTTDHIDEILSVDEMPKMLTR